MRINSKSQILERVADSSLDLSKNLIKSDDDIKKKMDNMLEIAKKVRGLFESVHDFNLFMKMFSIGDFNSEKHQKNKKKLEEQK